MSGFRRHLMAEIANRSFIEGYCNVYNSTFTFYLNFTNSLNDYTQIDVTTDSNGYWRYKLANGQKVVYLNNCFSRYSQAESNKLVSIRFSDKFCADLISYHNTFGNNSADTYACRNLQYVYNMRSANMYEFGLQGTFRGCTSLIEVFTNFESVKRCTFLLRTFQDCQNLKKIHGIENWDVQAVTRIEMMFRNCPSLESDSTAPFDLSGWQTTNLTTFHGLFYISDSDATNWYNTHGWRPYSKLRDVRLFSLPNSYGSQLNFPNFYGGQDNFSIGNLSKTVTFVNADLNLQSAINILSALTDLQGGSATLTFSSSTLALVQESINNGDADTISAVTNAIDNGWTITGLNVIYGYAYDNQGVYPATVTIGTNGSIGNTTINVDGNSGFFIYSTNVTSLRYGIQTVQTVQSMTVYAPDKSLNLGSFARKSNVESLTFIGVTATYLYISFGLNFADINDGYISHLKYIKLPKILNSTDYGVGNSFANADVLTDVECDFIEKSINLSDSPLTLQSAINVLNALQDVTSYGGATLKFSATTKGYINNDQDALALVANAVNNLGWTIALT